MREELRSIHLQNNSHRVYEWEEASLIWSAQQQLYNLANSCTTLILLMLHKMRPYVNIVVLRSCTKNSLSPLYVSCGLDISNADVDVCTSPCRMAREWLRVKILDDVCLARVFRVEVLE